MRANIPGLILLSGAFGGDLAISNLDLYSVSCDDEGMTAPLLVTHETVGQPPANTSSPSTQQSDLYRNISSLVESLWERDRADAGKRPLRGGPNSLSQYHM